MGERITMAYIFNYSVHRENTTQRTLRLKTNS